MEISMDMNADVGTMCRMANVGMATFGIGLAGPGRAGRVPFTGIEESILAAQQQWE